MQGATDTPWRQKMVQPSIGGVPFEWADLDESLGRNVASYEYVASEDVYGEDLGRVTDTATVAGYVWGPEVLDKVAAIKKVVRAPGPVEFVDRWGERTMVHIKRLSIRRSAKKGGWADLSFELAEAGTESNPATTVNTATLVQSRADEALPMLADDFALSFDSAGPAFVGEDALALLGDAGSMLGGLSSQIASGGRPLAAFQRNLSGFTGGAGTLMGTPATLAGRLQGLVAQLLGLSKIGLPRFGTASKVTGFGATRATVAATTPSRARQAANATAITNLVRRTALVEQVRASSDVTYPTRAEAVATRDQLTSALDAEIATAPDPVVFRLRRLQAAMATDLTSRGGDLSRLADYTPAATLPALVIAHRLHGDARREGEILARNPRVANPLAVPGGIALKVVADG